MELSSNCSVSRKQYGVIDILRMVMAIGVLFIHRGYVIENKLVFYIIRNCICEIAVPFFVCTTAFFFYKKCLNLTDKQAEKELKKYIKHLLILFAVWSAIYVPVYLYKNWFVKGLSVSVMLKNYLYDFFVGGQTYLHLWYIQALIVASGIIFFLSRRFSDKALLLIFYGLYVLYNFGSWTQNNRVTEIFSIIPAAILNYTCRISIFILIGKFIAENREKNNKKRDGLFLLLTVILETVACIIRYNYGDTGIIFQYAVLPWIIFFVFSYAICFDFSFKNENEFRKVTELFYFSHLIVPTELYLFFFETVGFKDLSYNVVFTMAFYIVFSLLFSIAAVKLSKTKAFRFLKYLY